VKAATTFSRLGSTPWHNPHRTVCTTGNICKICLSAANRDQYNSKGITRLGLGLETRLQTLVSESTSVVSNSNCSLGQMRSYIGTRGPHYDANATIAAVGPY